MRPAPARGRLLDHVAPELQAHLGDHRLARDPGRARHLEVEGIERPEPRPRRRGRGHRRRMTVRIAPLDQRRAGLEAHAAGSAIT